MPRRCRSRRIARGVYEDAYGFRVVWPLLGKPKCKRFPRDTPLERLKEYRRQQIDRALQRRGLDRTGSFIRDGVRFLRPRRGPDALVRDVALELRKHEVLGYLRSAKTRARYLVDATCGQRPVQHMRAQPADVDLERRIWFVDGAKHDNGAIVYLNDDMAA